VFAGICSKSEDFMPFAFLLLQPHTHFSFLKAFLLLILNNTFSYFKCICKALMLLEFKTLLKSAAHSSISQEIFMYVYS